MLDLAVTRLVDLEREDYGIKRLQAEFNVERGNSLDISFVEDDFSDKYTGFAYSAEDKKKRRC